MLSIVSCGVKSCLSEEDIALLEAIGRQVAIAIENAQLWEEMRKNEQLRGILLRKLISAQEEERGRIARELHDETGQALTSLLINLSLLEKVQKVDEIHRLVAEMRRLTGETLEGIRHLAIELRPAVLDDLGLVPALSRLAEQSLSRLGLRVDFVSAGLRGVRLSHEIENTLYRIAQEAITNIARHAHASHASVLLERRGNVIILIVEDDGAGFDVEGIKKAVQDQERLGLFGMQERAILVGGHLSVESKSGIGTTVSVEIPLKGEQWTVPSVS